VKKLTFSGGTKKKRKPPNAAGEEKRRSGTLGNRGEGGERTSPRPEVMTGKRWEVRLIEGPTSMWNHYVRTTEGINDGFGKRGEHEAWLCKTKKNGVRECGTRYSYLQQKKKKGVFEQFYEKGTHTRKGERGGGGGVDRAKFRAGRPRTETKKKR